MRPPAAGSVGEALAAASAALDAAGVETARLDAELLLAEATGLERAAIVAAPDAEVDAPAARAFGAMVRRRVGREPVAYILGRKGFRRLELGVDTRVLVPRPETELLVEVALELSPDTVLDVGTGSGAIALAVADELPEARVLATDSSPDALAVARENARRLGLADRVAFADPGEPLSREFDLVLANLPYVGEREWVGLAPEITRFEPRGALVAGPTGLEAIELVLKRIAARGPDAGAVAFEVGVGQADAVAELVRGAGFEAVVARRDLAGIERVVVGRR